VGDLQNHFKNRLEVKFREGSGIRSRNGDLTVVEELAKGEPPYDEFSRVQEILYDLSGGYAVLRMHKLSEATLDSMKAEGDKATLTELPNLNLWYYLYVDPGSLEALADLINRLNALEIVEFAYASDLPAPPPRMDDEAAAAFEEYWKTNDYLPWPTRAEILQREKGTVPPPSAQSGPKSGVSPPVIRLTVEPPPLPGNYEPNQDYGEAAPVGIDVDYVRGNYWNSTGLHWGYTDCEYSWNKSHADLLKIAGSVYVNGTPAAAAMAYRDHGTSVIGELSSDNNGWGTTGLTPDSAVRLSTEWPTTGPDRTSAITSAAAQFWKGAVILLEMQTGAGFDCNGTDPGTDYYVPTEWRAADKDAIKTATANGRIVVEAAGNGNCNLDHASFFGAFNPNTASQDSGAIIVGAGEKNTRNKASFSTYGSRVDCHAEGDWQIYTTGKGDHYNAEGENYWYTDTFAGTSGASPIVTGAAVSLASMLWIYNGSIYAPKEMRDLLRRDGTPQGTGGHIGPRPDLKKQVEHMNNRHLQMHSADFDGDGKSDYAVFRPSTGVWWIRYATGATASYPWGTKGDIPCPADVNGDGRAELIVFRPSSGTWWIRYWNGTTAAYNWGAIGDIPIPLDYDGDGRAELVVYRWSTDDKGRWWIRYWNGSSTMVEWGIRTDTPLSRDIDGDKKDDLIVYRKDGTWYIRYTKGGSAAYVWGTWGDVPLCYRDSQGKWNIAVWRPSNGIFWYKNIQSGGTGSYYWGTAGDIPRVADPDGDKWDDFIVYRPSTGVWWPHAEGSPVGWGAVGDIAISK
jgi:hypothetical protein